MTRPLVSVVMPSFNQHAYIERAVESVFNQDYDKIELIVSDGGSTDGTCETLTRLSEIFPALSWVSEPDNGPADAINKALARVRGTIIGWLNSDDLYAPGAVERAVQGFETEARWVMCYGHGEHVDEFDQYIEDYPTQRPDIGLSGFAEGCYICQPTVFFKTSLLTLIGRLDERYKTSFDYEYWMRVFAKLPDRVGFIDEVQAKTRLHADTITASNRLDVALEGLELGHKYLGQARIEWLNNYFREARPSFVAQSDLAGFQRHVETVLEKAAPYIDRDALERLRDNLARFTQ